MPNTLPNQDSFPVVTNSQTATIPYPTSGFATYSLTGASATITNFNSITFFVTAGATLTLSGGANPPTRDGLTIANAVYVAGTSAQQVTINAENFGADQVKTLSVTASGGTIYLIIS